MNPPTWLVIWIVSGCISIWLLKYGYDKSREIKLTLFFLSQPQQITLLIFMFVFGIPIITFFLIYVIIKKLNWILNWLRRKVG